MEKIQLQIIKKTKQGVSITSGIAICVLGVLAFFKLKFPKNTGLFIEEGQFKAFGILKSTTRTSEVLGYWFLPVIVFFLIVFTIIMSKSLRK
ncbi:hypothetical protein [Flavobacterium sp. J27]|uniref:hypothetical protein n=1 Tax=Flavobacterium sp. J27 TaxID=2060419 RepID=UPI0010326775|nr:hypothetical protein [Flavobacterium sp. J27]